MSAFEDYERFTTEPEELDADEPQSCDCGGAGCQTCDAEWALMQHTAAAITSVLFGAPFGGVR